jgi:general L-amino acid transport system permease protein
MKLPFIEWTSAHWWTVLAFVAGAIADLAYSRVMRQRQYRTGQPRKSGRRRWR